MKNLHNALFLIRLNNYSSQSLIEKSISIIIVSYIHTKMLENHLFFFTLILWQGAVNANSKQPMKNQFLIQSEVKR